MTPREDDATSTPPHGDPLRDHNPDDRSATRHGVELDPRGQPDDAEQARDRDVPSTPRSHPDRGQTP